MMNKKHTDTHTEQQKNHYDDSKVLLYALENIQTTTNETRACEKKGPEKNGPVFKTKLSTKMMMIVHKMHQKKHKTSAQFSESK